MRHPSVLEEPLRSCATSGFTLMELLVVIAILGVITAMTVPAVLRARMSANEASAIESLRTIHSAQTTYASSCGGTGYAQTLVDLHTPPPGSTSGFLSPDLSADGVLKSGYILEVTADAGAIDVVAPGTACNANTAATVSAYFAEAHPQSVGSTGRRSFAIDRRGALFFSETGAAIPRGMAGASVWP